MLEIDEEELRAALQDDLESVESIFSNDTEDGVADAFDEYRQGVTSTTGFLNERARTGGSIDGQIDWINNRIDMLEYQLGREESRLRKQFNALEVAISSFQATSQYLQQHLTALNNTRW